MRLRGDGMKYTALRDVCEINMGQSPDSSSYNEEGRGIPFFQGNADFGERNPVTRVWCDAPSKIAKANDILISVRAPIGAVNYATETCCIGRGLAAITPDLNRVSSEYVFWLLKGKNAELNSKGTGSTFKAINRKALEEIQVPAISLEEQEAYAANLEAVYKIVQLRKQQLSELDDLIKARFVELIEKSNLSDETTIESITERVKVGFVGTCEKYYTDKSGIPMLRTSNITEKGIDLSDLKYVTAEFHDKNKKSQIHTGDLLIARHGSNGQANVYYGPDAQCLNAVVIVPNQKIASSVFLAGLINSPGVKRQIERTLVGSTQHVVNTKSIASLTVRIPNKAVQKEYESFVMQIDKSKSVIQKSLDETQLLFDSLMQKYFG